MKIKLEHGNELIVIDINNVNKEKPVNSIKFTMLYDETSKAEKEAVEFFKGFFEDFRHRYFDLITE